MVSKQVKFKNDNETRLVWVKMFTSKKAISFNDACLLIFFFLSEFFLENLSIEWFKKKVTHFTLPNKA